MESGQRLYIDREHPLVYRAALSFADAAGKAADQAGLGRDLVELINLRCSQINACPACLKAHAPQAIRAGVDATRLAVLPAWRDAEIFTDVERAVLDIAELTTEMPQPRDAQERYDRAAAALTPDQLSAAIWVASAINTFNRISIMSGHPVR